MKCLRCNKEIFANQSFCDSCYETIWKKVNEKIPGNELLINSSKYCPECCMCHIGLVHESYMSPYDKKVCYNCWEKSLKAVAYTQEEFYELPKSRKTGRRDLNGYVEKNRRKLEILAKELIFKKGYVSITVRTNKWRDNHDVDA